MDRPSFNNNELFGEIPLKRSAIPYIPIKHNGGAVLWIKP